MTGGCTHVTDPTFDGVWCHACQPALTPEDPRVQACARALHEQGETRAAEALARYTPRAWEGLAESARAQMAADAVEIVAAIDAAEPQQEETHAHPNH